MRRKERKEREGKNSPDIVKIKNKERISDKNKKWIKMNKKLKNIRSEEEEKSQHSWIKE